MYLSPNSGRKACASGFRSSSPKRGTDHYCWAFQILVGFTRGSDVRALETGQEAGEGCLARYCVFLRGFFCEPSLLAVAESAFRAESVTVMT
jgi:hypothetical protein